MSLLYILKSGVAFFAGSDLYDVFDIVYKDLSVSDMTGVQYLLSRLYYRSDRYLAHNDIELNLRKKRCLNLCAAVVLGLALLLAAA